MDLKIQEFTPIEEHRDLPLALQAAHATDEREFGEFQRPDQGGASHACFESGQDLSTALEHHFLLYTTISRAVNTAALVANLEHEGVEEMEPIFLHEMGFVAQIWACVRPVASHRHGREHVASGWT